MHACVYSNLIMCFNELCGVHVVWFMFSLQALVYYVSGQGTLAFTRFSEWLSMNSAGYRSLGLSP